MARFDCANWRPINTNQGGRLSANLGLVLHHAVANGSLFGVFSNPARRASTHFWVSKSGVIEQYVDSDVVTWHGVALNSRYCSVETEGCATSPYAEPMTDAMINALARLYAEGNRRHGWPFQLCQRDGERGFGFHRMPGGPATACPCDVRLNRRSEILNRARGQPATKRTSGRVFFEGQYNFSNGVWRVWGVPAPAGVKRPSWSAGNDRFQNSVQLQIHNRTAKLRSQGMSRNAPPLGS